MGLSLSPWLANSPLFPRTWCKRILGSASCVWRLLLAEADGELDEDALDAMFEQVEAGELVDTAPAEMWPELVRGLMARSPAKMIQALRQCGALREVLPEVAALFGVPQIADDPAEVDLGDHLLNTPCRGGTVRRAFGGAFLLAGDECRQGGFATRAPAGPLSTY